MLLAVDIGNTQTVIGLIDDGAVINDWRIATVSHRTGDEIAGLLSGFLSWLHEEPRLLIDEVAVASVVPRLTTQWVEMSVKHLGVTPLVIGPGVRTGIKILIKNPLEVGADRIVNTVAAFERYGGPCIVVDFGTATTFDIVSADGDYLGGVIAPGIEVSMEALTTRAARLTKVDLIEPAQVIGKSTVECLQSGAVYGFGGQVEGIVAAIRGELGVDVKVVATGGLAPLIAPHARSISEIDEHLTLRGIEIILRRQRSG